MEDTRGVLKVASPRVTSDRRTCIYADNAGNLRVPGSANARKWWEMVFTVFAAGGDIAPVQAELLQELGSFEVCVYEGVGERELEEVGGRELEEVGGARWSPAHQEAEDQALRRLGGSRNGAGARHRSSAGSAGRRRMHMLLFVF